MIKNGTPIQKRTTRKGIERRFYLEKQQPIKKGE